MIILNQSEIEISAETGSPFKTDLVFQQKIHFMDWNERAPPTGTRRADRRRRKARHHQR